MSTPNYKEMGMKVGLELHQQLSTRSKLFCACPPYSATETGKENETFPISFTRILRPSTSELGETDEAALFESRRPTTVRYFADNATSCLVEADEEPPHDLNPEALETSILFALALRSKIMDEIHVMRKLVIDGSNTSGFQRTAVIALGGELDCGLFRVGVQSITLEEDSARALGGVKKSYALDRLGTPLVEVALEPLERPPEEIEVAAKSLGRLMRSTHRVARGLGTIRQDINMSVMGGNVVEVKGVQKLDLLAKVIRFEALRQKFFHDLSMEINEKIGSKIELRVEDVTRDFIKTESKLIVEVINNKDEGTVQCIVASGMRGYIGRENSMKSRLGKELGSIARAFGLGGVLHSDELPGYGITPSEVQSLRSKLQLKEDDAFILLAGPRSIVQAALPSLIRRIQLVTAGVPAETRAATEDGETVFLRPRPGAARMYPETDIPLIQPSKELIERLRKVVPEPWEKQIDEFAKRYGLPLQLAEPLFDSERRPLFERLVSETKLSSSYIASVLLDVLTSLARAKELKVENLTDERLESAFAALDRGEFAKEALPSILKTISSSAGMTLERALSTMGLGAMKRQEVEEIVDATIAAEKELVIRKGEGAKSALMGRVMQRVRGRADGKIVSEVLTERLERFLQKEKIKQ